MSKDYIGFTLGTTLFEVFPTLDEAYMETADGRLIKMDVEYFTHCLQEAFIQRGPKP